MDGGLCQSTADKKMSDPSVSTKEELLTSPTKCIITTIIYDYDGWTNHLISLNKSPNTQEFNCDSSFVYMSNCKIYSKCNTAFIVLSQQESLKSDKQRTCLSKCEPTFWNTQAKEEFQAACSFGWAWIYKSDHKLGHWDYKAGIISSLFDLDSATTTRIHLQWHWHLCQLWPA